MIFEKVRSYLKNNSYNINISKNYLYINNYLTIDNLSEKNIRISLNNVDLEIEGKELKVVKMLDDEILINGQIESVKLINDRN